MDKDDLLKKLNWFYNLELNQVDLYTSLTKGFSDKYKSLVFERIAYIEQQHVDNIGAIIKELGGKPNPLGDVISPIIGSVAGTLLSLTGTEKILQGVIILEEKAMQDYQNLIISLPETPENKELVRILQSNLIDEDLHTSWFKENLASTEK